MIAEIKHLAEEKANQRLNETIAGFFSLLKRDHQHKAHLTCDCSYCKFIRNIYTPHKIRIHHLEKRMKNHDHINEYIDYVKLGDSKESFHRMLEQLVDKKEELLTEVI